MTEAEWLTSADPAPMLEFLLSEGSDRKLRLFAVACCRRIWHFLDDDRSRKAVEVAERYADEVIDESERRAIRRDALEAASQGSHESWACQRVLCRKIADCFATPIDTSEHLGGVPDAVVHAAGLNAHFVAAKSLGWGPHVEPILHTAEECERNEQTISLRDIFGNSFRPVTIDPRWLTSNVVDLANAIYSERAFDRMPILSDALMDAGCDSEEVLNHCRSEGPHVRGCWVVDLLTGRE